MSYRLRNHKLPQAESIKMRFHPIDDEMKYPACPGRINNEDSDDDDYDSDSSYGRSDPGLSIAGGSGSRRRLVSPTPWEKFFPLDKFTLYFKLPLELRTMVIKFSLPRAAIIQLRHETYQYKSRGHQERSVRMIVDTTDNFKIKQLRESRALALLRVNTEFRDQYIKALPLSLHICHARRQRIESKLRFSNEDLLYCKTFFGVHIRVDRTFDALVRQDIFKGVTQIALCSNALNPLNSYPSVLTRFLKTFPRLNELKVLRSYSTPSPNATSITCGHNNYHGGNPDPVGGAPAASPNDAQAVANILTKMPVEADVLSGKATVPRFMFF